MFKTVYLYTIDFMGGSMSCLNYCLLVTGPAYGTQQASSAYQFAKALLITGHQLTSIFFIVKECLMRTN